MAFDKVKTLRAAEKLLQMGKIPAAIKEYCQIVESEPDDFTTLNMLGDLYVRVGNQPTAISCFRRIAEHYSEQDFALKAIAMYKKIDRLQPHNTEISTKLADLYAQQDLVVEARAHYLVVAEAHTRSGATREALEVLRKIADLDPQNTEIRTKLAYGYLKEGLSDEAATAFTDAGQNLLTRGALDAALESFGRALEIRPVDQTSLKGLLDAHSARGTADEAAEIIERAVNDNPDDLGLFSMLAMAYVAADDPARAEQTTAALVSREPSAYLRQIDVARLYLNNDKIEDAVRLVAGIAEQMLAEREENQLCELVDELLACDSDNVQALRLLVRAHGWQRDTEKLKDALERLAEAAQRAGLEKDERYALTQLTRLVPDQAHHLERLSQLGGADEDFETETLPQFEVADSSSEAESETVEDRFVFESEEISPPASEAEVQWIPATNPEQWADSDPETSIERGFTFEAVVAEELSSSGEEGAVSDSSEARNAALRAQELESVDFYIAQGYVDIAIDSLDLLERQFGSHEDIDVRRQQLRELNQAGRRVAKETRPVIEKGSFADSAPQPAPPPAPMPLPVIAPSPVTPVNQKPAAEPVQSGIHPSLAEVFEEYRISAEREADTAVNGDYETHYNLGLAYKEMDLFEEALEEFQVAVGLVNPGDGTPRYLQCCNLLGHCFMQKGVPELALKWFNKGFNAPGASEDERQALRYEVAAAYEQIGDLDRAIDLFTEVYGINVSYRGVSERLRELKARAGAKNGNAAKPTPPHRRGKGRKRANQ